MEKYNKSKRISVNSPSRKFTGTISLEISGLSVQRATRGRISVYNGHLIEKKNHHVVRSLCI